MSKRTIGIDVGTETIKLVQVTERNGVRAWTHRTLAQHDKEPGRALLAEIAELGWDDVSGACVTGRMGRLVDLP
ncbi:MAG TPA: hypothetical protein VLM85_04020, partial [Polyangiaceae bacterium]|nr:hypothetical protein [Polyangiaceae bacterium]